MGLRFPSQIYGRCFFITTSFHRHRRLGDKAGVYEALAKSLAFYCRRYRGDLLGYVFMPTHIHLVLSIDGRLLGPFMRDFKKFTSQKALSDLGAVGDRIWQNRYDRVVVTSEDVLRTKLEYMHQNPLRAGLVHEPCQWRWSSARAYRKEESETVLPVALWRL